MVVVVARHYTIRSSAYSAGKGFDLGWLPANALLALGAAALWGGGDFSGGLGVRAGGGGMAAALRFVALSHAVGLCLLLALAIALGTPIPHGPAVAWAVAAGISGGLAVAVFYVALSQGAMGSAAAVSGLLAAAIPALLSSVLEGAPGLRRLAGFLAAGFAIWLIGAGNTKSGLTRGMGLAALSGAGFGLFFIALRFAGAAGVVWPMVMARVASMSVCGLLLLAWPGRRRLGSMHRPAVSCALAAAVLDAGGNMFFVAATRAGRLDVAAVISSLYPATTILLAAWRLKESPTRRQQIGMGIAAAAVVLITL